MFGGSPGQCSANSGRRRVTVLGSLRVGTWLANQWISNKTTGFGGAEQ